MIDPKLAVIQRLKVWFTPVTMPTELSLFGSLEFGSGPFGIIVVDAGTTPIPVQPEQIWREHIPYPSVLPAVAVSRSSHSAAVQFSFWRDVIVISVFVDAKMPAAYGIADEIAAAVEDALLGWGTSNGQIYVESIVPAGLAELLDTDARIIQRHVSVSVLYAAKK